MQSDSKTKAELLALYRRNGMMSDEQIARKLNLKREAGGTYWVEANLIERDRALAEPEPTPEPAPDRELSLKLTNSIVGRLSRRAAKSGKLEINLWQEELGDLPGFVAAADYLENNPIDQFKTETITGLLWTTN